MVRSLGNCPSQRQRFCLVRSGGRPSRSPRLRSCTTRALPHLVPAPVSDGLGTTIPQNGCLATSIVSSSHAAKCEAVIRRLGRWQSRGPGVLSFPSRSRLSRTLTLRSLAMCVLAAPGSGSHFGCLGEGDPTTRLSDHKRCGCQPCRVAGGCGPLVRELSVPETPVLTCPERRPSFPNA